ncbi:hypothetical protein [Streptomyces nigra]|uniref:hypothetical protein n=1 Tax=Streptomyces nigra TaxID=1827580 RepID=UPI0035E1DA4A
MVGVSSVTPLILVAVLVVRTVVRQVRDPDGARAEWAFVTDRVAWAGGAVTALAVGGTGWSYGRYAVVAWALLAGLLVAQLMGRRSER